MQSDSSRLRWSQSKEESSLSENDVYWCETDLVRRTCLMRQSRSFIVFISIHGTFSFRTQQFLVQSECQVIADRGNERRTPAPAPPGTPPSKLTVDSRP
jgi:hypothetical protein